MQKEIIVKRNIYECSCIFKKLGLCKSYKIFKKGDKLFSENDFIRWMEIKCLNINIFEKYKNNKNKYIEDCKIYLRKNKLLKLNENNNSKWLSKIWKR